MTEAELTSVVLEAARLLGWRTAHFRTARTQHGWRTPVQGDAKGFPDLVLVRDRVVFVELKGRRGRLSAEQKDWLAALAAAGIEVHVWREQDWMDGAVERALYGTGGGAQS